MEDEEKERLELEGDISFLKKLLFLLLLLSYEVVVLYIKLFLEAW